MKKPNYTKIIDELVASGILPACVKQVRREVCLENGFEIETNDGDLLIKHKSPRGFFHALGVLSSKQTKIGNKFYYKKLYSGENLGYMIDCSRNAVVNKATLKRLILILALSGYTYLALYTEDTYEIEDEPYFGYQRGRFSVQEIQEIVEYAEEYGMEVVPYIQTLAHLTTLFHWDAYRSVQDVKGVLLCESEETYALIDKMIAACRKAYKTNRINIGCDEATLMGTGKYLQKFGYKKKNEIMLAHLTRVVQICQKYEFEPFAWGDLFFRTAFNGEYPLLEYKEFPEEIKQSVPEGLRLMHWSYYQAEEKDYSLMFDMYRNLGEQDLAFATGAICWRGYVPEYELTEKSALPALRACAKNGVRDVLVTGWGDDGFECSIWGNIGLLILMGTADQQGVVSYDDANDLCSLLTGYSYNEWKVLGKPDKPYEGSATLVNPTKYLIYNNLLIGLFDKHIADTFPLYYKNLACEIGELAQRESAFSWCFKVIAELCEILSLKCSISLRLRVAYIQKEMQTLGALKAEIEQLIALQEECFADISQQWLNEKKGFGLEVLATRWGGEIMNNKLAASRITALMKGEIEKIDELECERLTFMKNIPDVWPKPNILEVIWENIITPGNI